ncbi:TetR/AcrR family transcriptional regulator [Diaminobutyricibacter sp. McL0618]|uniref:TetR/AcrR family transcriptional regulator n=1 Tax=Leifsonia sp. McL0618 TaxID=3415677 RepID=UPI003CF787E1
MPKVTDAHREARRHEIATAALRCFARKGFAATSMADIIAESGLSAGAIYGHYKSKDELITLAIMEVLDLRFGELEFAQTQTPMPSPGEMVRVVMSGLQHEVGELSILVQIWAHAAVEPGVKSTLARVGDRVKKIFHDYLRTWYLKELGLPEAEAERGAQLYSGLYVGIVQGYIVQSSIFIHFDGDAYLDAAAAMVPAL